jgi:hypothetical protein
MLRACVSRECGCAHTLFTGQRERERKREKERERERKREREREREREKETSIHTIITNR